MNRAGLYWCVNAGFLLLLGIGATIGSASSAHLLYLALLFALCTTPIFNAGAFNDRYALLVIFSAIYFQFFGMLDLFNLFRGSGTVDGIISHAETVILIGGSLLHICYRLVARHAFDRSNTAPKDWPEQWLIPTGVLIWLIATWFTWQFKVNILTETTAAATARGLGSIGPWQTVGYLLAGMMQPLGILIIAYAQCRYQRNYLLPLLIVVVLVQLAFGFIIDVKGEALIGAVLVMVTRLLVNGKVPKGWIIAFVTFIVIAFPAMQANRTLRNQYRLDNTEVAANLMDMIRNTFSAGDEISSGTRRAQTVFERASLKGSVEMIVTRTGDDVEFQHGHTLSPLYAAFIPKVFWPNKPEVATGQLVNKEFKVTNFSYTYISPSHLGELYWNFGWPGVVIGMSLIGCLLGLIGRYIDMTQGASITQLMIAAITIKQLALGFESTVAACYVVWLRSLASIMLLHLSLGRSTDENNVSEITTRTVSTQTSSVNFPNLMR